MDRSSFLHNLQSRLRDGGRVLRSLAQNVYFWKGLAALFAVIIVVYFLFNHLLMPTYTRHGVAVQVPAVVNTPFEEAAQVLREHDLHAEKVLKRFEANLPRDTVVDQNPPPNAHVKPGRRVYLTVNTGRTPMVQIPPLKDLSLREARNRLQAVGLEVEEELPDSIPSPFRNTVTRQDPAPGDSLEQGAGVTLWYSTGLGDRYVTMPDVTGLPPDEAQRRLLSSKIRSVIVGGSRNEAPFDENPAADQVDSTLVVWRQSREPGTRVREGFEIRLFVRPSDEVPLEEEDQL